MQASTDHATAVADLLSRVERLATARTVLLLPRVQAILGLPLQRYQGRPRATQTYTGKGEEGALLAEVTVRDVHPRSGLGLGAHLAARLGWSGSGMRPARLAPGRIEFELNPGLDGRALMARWGKPHDFRIVSPTHLGRSPREQNMYSETYRPGGVEVFVNHGGGSARYLCIDVVVAERR